MPKKPDKVSKIFVSVLLGSRSRSEVGGARASETGIVRRLRLRGVTERLRLRRAASKTFLKQTHFSQLFHLIFNENSTILHSGIDGWTSDVGFFFIANLFLWKDLVKAERLALTLLSSFFPLNSFLDLEFFFYNLNYILCFFIIKNHLVVFYNP